LASGDALHRTGCPNTCNNCSNQLCSITP
jgi:hypothetical protein